jgi:hypothetical protein
MSKISGEVILTMPDGTNRRFPTSDILQLLTDVTSPAASETLAMFRECTGARSTSGRLHELVFAYLNGPAREVKV